jgi:hypothetical protein
MTWYAWVMLLFGASGAATSILQLYRWVAERHNKKGGDNTPQ